MCSLFWSRDLRAGTAWSGWDVVGEFLHFSSQIGDDIFQLNYSIHPVFVFVVDCSDARGSLFHMHVEFKRTRLPLLEIFLKNLDPSVCRFGGFVDHSFGSRLNGLKAGGGRGKSRVDLLNGPLEGAVEGLRDIVQVIQIFPVAIALFVKVVDFGHGGWLAGCLMC